MNAVAEKRVAVSEPGSPGVRVPYVDLAIQDDALRARLLEAVEGSLLSGQYILGGEVERFEQRFAELCGVRHAIGVANGTDAIVLILKGLGIGAGDEVITAPNSFLASASAVFLAGATPRFADVQEGSYNLDPQRVEEAITPKTKAILAVHLTGNPADMAALSEIAERHDIYLLEDAAQAVGAKSGGKPVGSLGKAAAFSLHPLKNLAAAGDGGVITTDDDELAEWLRVARNHGLENRDTCRFWSVNSRLDTLHAAMLNVKLDYLPQGTDRRREIALRYRDLLSGIVGLPEVRTSDVAVYHTFVIRAERRDELQNYLAEKGIDTKVHYPIPIHLQPSAKELGYKPGDFPVTDSLTDKILSLPVYPELTDEQVERVASEIRRFYGA